MIKTLIVLAQFHSLSGEPVHNIPAFSWQNPGWSEGRTDFNVSSHVPVNAGSTSFNPSYCGSSSMGSGGGSVPPSRLNNDFGNID